MKTKFITLVLALVVMSFGISFGQQSISLDNITGTMWHNQPDSMFAGSTYVFNIRMTNNTATKYIGISNGFRVYSDDGANWTTTIGDTTGALGSGNFTVFSINPDTLMNGSVVDTIGFGGIDFGSLSGLAANFDAVTYSITIGPITGGPSAHGKTICLDSSWYSPTGTWKWAETSADAFPTWDGPHCYTIVDETTDITDGEDGLPNSFALAQNYPNPFNPSTTINYDLPKNSDVSMKIYNVTGQLVKEFTEENKTAGTHSFEWDASFVASGVYFYKIVAGDFTDTKKMMLLK